jgi:Zn-dependent protease
MKIHTSKVELKHLFISWIAISYAFTIADYSLQILFINPMRLLAPFIISLFTVGTGFLFHELAHKSAAQKYGCWAEYRMDLAMLFFAVLLASFTGVVFAAPGAVYISSYYLTKKENGKISLAGPLANLILAIFFLAIAFSSRGLLKTIATSGLIVNTWLAAFNLIPFGPLDGKKVWDWSKTIYLTVAIIAFGSMAFIIALLI